LALAAQGGGRREVRLSSGGDAAGLVIHGRRVGSVLALDQKAEEKDWAEKHAEEAAKVKAMENSIWGPPAPGARAETAGRKEEDTEAVAAEAQRKAEAQRRKDLEESKAQWTAVQDWEKDQEARWRDAESWRKEQEGRWQKQEAPADKMEATIGDIQRRESEQEKRWAEVEEARRQRTQLGKRAGRIRPASRKR